jgi:NAD+ synthase
MNTHAVISHIKDWLLNYATKAGANGFVVGISGGIDSAVTSALCAETGLPVLCLEMPIHQPQTHVSRAWEHIHILQKKHPKTAALTMNLSPLYDQFLSTLINTDTPKHDLALANMRSRMRMLSLYYHAQLNNFLVAGTGNKVEDFGIGFYTKYGDGGVDISPIADLMKTEVFALGAALGVPKSILDAKPTDGLWGDDRSDEDQIGASYPELERAMRAAESGKTIADFSGREAEVMKIYTTMHARNKHKMEPIPVCLIPDELR